MSENKNYRRPTAVATLVLVAGAAASVAINLKAISLGHSPEIGAYVSGVAWPLALFGAIELLIHTPWDKSKGDLWIKGAVLMIVAGVAAWVSYWHGAHVLSHWGYDEVSRYAGPFVPDAAMGLATLALQRVATAKRLAKDVVATVATAMELATATPIVATAPLTVATPESATSFYEDLASDWDGLEDEVAAYVETARAEEIVPDNADDYGHNSGTVKLTKVTVEAAEMIDNLLGQGVAGKDIDKAIEAAGLGAARTARRWRGALIAGTAKVS